MVYFDQMLQTYYLFILTIFRRCMQNGDDALSSINLTGQGILVRMLITLNGMLYKYTCILIKNFILILDTGII